MIQRVTLADLAGCVLMVALFGLALWGLPLFALIFVELPKP